MGLMARNLVLLLISLASLVTVCSAQNGKKCDFTKVGIWSNCGNKNTTKADCEKLDCCYASDAFKVARNLTQHCAKPPGSFVWKNGTCSSYNGSVCIPYIGNGTLGRRIFFDTRYGILGTEGILKQFISISDFSVRTAVCRKLIPAGICHMMLPYCDRNERPLLACREDCDVIFKTCHKDMDRFYGGLELYIKQNAIQFSHISVPTCPDFKYSYDHDPAKNESCRFIGLFKHQKPTPKPPDNKTRNAIIIGACAAVALICLIVLLVCKHRQTKKREYQKQEANKDMEMFSSFTTVRDRIRQDSMPNPLEEALAKLTEDQKPPQCELDKVEYVKDLGQGQFGKVFQGQLKIGDQSTALNVAVKTLKEGSSAETKDSFIQEVTLMSVLHHENILKLLAVSTEEEPFCMVFEFMVNGDLNQYLRKNDPENAQESDKVVLPLGVLVHMAKQIASGMEYLGTKRFVHRDLATRNCLVGEDFVVKIADFGMSRDVYESDYYRVGGAAMLPIRWMPPEALLYGRFTVESDVYSYGILLWEIFTFALQPFYGYSNDEVVKFIKKGVVLPRPDICPQEVYDKIMTRCWIREPENRVNFTEIVKRFDGDYDFTIRRPQKAPKRGPEPNYSVPPNAKASKQDHPKRIPSKKESVTEPAQYVNINAGNKEDEQQATVELRKEGGAMLNPLYRNSLSPGDDLYDRPKSHPANEAVAEADEMKTVDLDARKSAEVQDTYDRPRSIPVPGDFDAGKTTSMPSKQKDTGDGHMYSVPPSSVDLLDDNDEDLDQIAKKRYISSKDAKRLSKKNSKSSSQSNSSASLQA